MATKTQQKTAMFISRNRGQRLVREPQHEQRTRDGKLVPVPGTGLVYQFENGRLDVNDALLERDRRYFDKHPDERTAGIDTLDWLRSHPRFGDGFVEITPEVPGPEDALAAIALAAHDPAELARILDEELEGHNRPVVVETATKALEALEQPKE